MFHHLLVPIDLGERNDRQLRAALTLAEQSRSRVTLLHVIQHIRSIPAGELRSFYGRIEKSAGRAVERAARRFAAAGLPVRTLVVIGEPSCEVVRVAARR
jgi:nucleotide-binding universal stress UspA family protein